MRIILILSTLLCSSSLLAQHFKLSGTIVDKDNAPLPAAHVALEYPWGELVKAEVAAADGRFAFSAVEQGGYVLHVTFLGFAAHKQEVTLQADLDVGPIRLEEGALNLEEVEVTETVVMATQQGDTTSYNADAFKTLPDANAEQLVEKMPGVVVQNGRVQAQGEDVKEVLVDGRPFFGNDPTAALRNLPAEVISKIQIFDQQSDQAQFSGVQDGETSKTINIITRPDMRAGQFGKVYAGYGTDERYQAGGSTNFFDGDRRISVIGQFNNTNQQNFSSEDLLSVTSGGGRGGFGGRGGRGGGRRGGRGSGGGGASAGDFLIDQVGGIASTQAIGINYSDRWGEKMEISGSYFFNHSATVSVEDINRFYTDSEDVTETYSESNQGDSDNYNHRFNFRLEYEIDSANSIIMRPRLSLQQNDGISSTFGQTIFGSTTLNQTDNAFRTDFRGANFNNSLTFRHRFSKARRTFSASFGMGYNDKIGESFLQSDNQYFNEMRADTLNQFAQLDAKGWNGSASLAYTEPIGERSMLMFNYRASLRADESDKETFNYSPDRQVYDELDESLTNVYTNDYHTQSIGGGYNFSKGRDFVLMARANFEWAKLQGEESFPRQIEQERTYYNLLPMLMLRLNFSRQENLRFFYRSNTQQPSLEQLQSVVDNSNPIQLSVGNPNLDQEYNHRLFTRYQKTNTEKSTVFFAMLIASFTQNNISNSVYLRPTNNPIFEDIELTRGTQLTRPVNLDGAANYRTFLSYGMPLTFIKSNLNFDFSADWVRTPGLIDDRLNYSNNRTLGVGLTLSSNISDKVDFTIATRSNFSNVDNSLRSELNDRYLNQASKLRIGIILPAGLVFRTELNHQLYDGLSADFDQSYLLWNLGLGKKLFKNQLGEITLSVFDLLQQNQSLNRAITEIYIEDSRTNVLQQYALLTFTYNFRNFNSGKQATRPGRDRDDERRRRFRGGGE